MRAALSSAAWVLAAACYQPTIPAGAPCSQSSDCPGEQACVERVCGGLGGSSPDAQLPDAPAPDAPPGTMVVVVGADKSQLRDTELFLDEPNSGHGDQDHFSVDSTETGLIKFSFSMIPPGATVTKATLKLVTTDEASEDGGTVLVFRMREDWDEGSATWFQSMAGKAWSTEGGGPPARDTTPVADVRPQQIFAPHETALPPQLVQEWIDQPQVNFGIALVRGTSVQHIHMRTRETNTWSTLTLELRH